jgi:hypothetical protein
MRGFRDDSPNVFEPQLLAACTWLRRFFAVAPWRIGRTHLLMEPVQFLARLASLVPPRH